MPNFAFWLSLPFVLPQALRTRARARRFSAPSGPQGGGFGADPGATIVGIGDSIIAGVGADTGEQTITAQFARCWSEAAQRSVAWRAVGRIGAKTLRIEQMAMQLPEDHTVIAVVVSVGVNDITGLTRTGAWLAAVERLINALQAKYPAAVVVMLGIPPLEAFPALPSPLRRVLGLRARHFDQRLREWLGQRARLRYLPIERRPLASEFAADGFHPSAASYALLAEEMVALIQPG